MSEDTQDIEIGGSTQDPIGELPMPWVYGVIPWGNPSDSKLVVFMTSSAFTAAFQHSQSDLYNEVGGILVGDIYFCPQAEKNYIVIEASLAATLATSSPTNVIFEHDAWSRVLTEKQNLYPRHRIVGWYHTHPGFGIFLSADDDFWHHTAFPNFWQVSMVCDPVANSGALFGWTGNNIELINGFYELLTRGQKFSSIGKVNMTWEFQRIRERPPAPKGSRPSMVYSAGEIMPGATRQTKKQGHSKNKDTVGNPSANQGQPIIEESVTRKGNHKDPGKPIAPWISVLCILVLCILLAGAGFVIWANFGPAILSLPGKILDQKLIPRLPSVAEMSLVIKTGDDTKRRYKAELGTSVKEIKWNEIKSNE